MNARNLFFMSVLLILSTVPAKADVMYQCIDEAGHKSFSNIKYVAKGSRCVAMDLGSATGAPPARGASKSPTPAAFPKVDDSAQKSRDTDRRRILESELAAEQKNLEQAKKDLAEQETVVLPNERMQRGGISGGKVEERVQPFRDKAALHERNIEAIQKEISRLR